MKIIPIGASTEDSDAIEHIVLNIPENFPYPVVFLQHALPEDSKTLANELNTLADIPVKIVSNKLLPKKSTAYIASTEGHLILNKFGIFEYSQHPKDVIFRPSIDLFFKSLAQNASPSTVILFPHACEDGLEGLLQLKKAGWTTIAVNHSNNSQATQAALQQGCASKAHILAEIPSILVKKMSIFTKK